MEKNLKISLVNLGFTFFPEGKKQVFGLNLKLAKRAFSASGHGLPTPEHRVEAINSVLEFMEEVVAVCEEEARGFKPLASDQVFISPGVRHMFWVHKLSSQGEDVQTKKFNTQDPYSAGIHLLKHRVEELKQTIKGSSPSTELSLFIKAWSERFA